MTNACKDITNGEGAQKVTSLLKLNSKTKLTLSLAKPEDRDLLLNWANDPVVRQNAFNKKIINKKTHYKWFNLVY